MGERPQEAVLQSSPSISASPVRNGSPQEGTLSRASPSVVGGPLRLGSKDVGSGPGVQRLSSRPPLVSEPSHSRLATGPSRRLRVRVLQGRGLAVADKNGLSDPYCIIKVGEVRQRTEVVPKTLNPIWNSLEWGLELEPHDHYLQVQVWDKDAFSPDECIGLIMVPITSLPETPTTDWYPVRKKSDGGKSGGEVMLQLSCIFAGTQPSDMMATFHYMMKEVENGQYVVAERITSNNTDRPFPGPKELVEVCLPGLVLGVSGTHQKGTLYLTNYRLCFITDRAIRLASSSAGARGERKEAREAKESSTIREAKESYANVRDAKESNANFRDAKESTYRDGNGNGKEQSLLPRDGTKSQVDFSLPNDSELKREKSERDELSSEVNISVNPFTKSELSMSVPLGLITGVAKQDGEAYLKVPAGILNVECRDFRTISLIFLQNDRSQLKAVRRRIEFHMRNQCEDVVRQFWADFRSEGLVLTQWDDFYVVQREYLRQGTPSSKWKLSTLNLNYELCSTYPHQVVLPADIDKDVVRASAKFRSRNRLPVLTWYNRLHGNFIARCAQPTVGLMQKSSEEDQQLIQAMRLAGSAVNLNLLIVDCRSWAAAEGNRWKGKGTERIEHYDGCKLLYMDIGNIHDMRKSLDTLKGSCESTTLGEGSWLSELERSQWLSHVRLVLSGATTIAYNVHVKKVSVLIHCSDGWDRTAQLSSLSQVLLDPYYRTLEGIKTLIQKDWLAFGHKFEERLGSPEHPSERSPIFVQFLDCLYQLVLQFPSSFEFNVEYLLTIAQHCQSGWFGNFLRNSEQERRQPEVGIPLHQFSVSIWARLDAARHACTNPHYTLNPNVIMPICSVKILRLWSEYYLRFDEAFFSDRQAREADEASDSESDGDEWTRSPGSRDETAERSDKTDRKQGLRSVSPVSDERKPGKAGRRKKDNKYSEAEEKRDSVVAGTVNNGHQLTRSARDAVVVWVPDEWSDECFECHSKFTLFRRRHHCRNCGRLFCSPCIEAKIPLPAIGLTQPSKVCCACYVVIVGVGRRHAIDNGPGGEGGREAAQQELRPAGVLHRLGKALRLARKEQRNGQEPRHGRGNSPEQRNANNQEQHNASPKQSSAIGPEQPISSSPKQSSAIGPEQSGANPKQSNANGPEQRNGNTSSSGSEQRSGNNSPSGQEKRNVSNASGPEQRNAPKRRSGQSHKSEPSKAEDPNQ